MSQRVLKFVAVVCLTACLYVFIAFSSHAKWYQKHLNNHNKYLQQVYSTHQYNKCCNHETTLRISTKLVSNHRTQHVIENSFKQNSTKLRILQQINQNNSLKSVFDKFDLVDANKYCDFHLSMIFTTNENSNTDKKNNKSLDRKLYQSLSSIAKHSNNLQICIHLISDINSQFRAKSIIRHILDKDSRVNDGIKFYFHDIYSANSVIEHLLPSLKLHFSYKSNSYYSHSLFFLSLAFHRIFKTIDKIILLDIDVQFNEDLSQLYSEFSKFNSKAVIGIAHEQQPVYYHILHDYRRRMQNETLLGSSPPNGFPGFNSGVLLMNLKRMRESKLYNSLLNSSAIEMLCNKYSFRGHLGDQDFYTIVSFDYQQLFHVIPCFWNRQLCQWWRYHGYGHVFDQYNRCDGDIKLFHGNCNAVMPHIK